MARKQSRHPDRRDFIRTAGAVTAGALVYPHLEAAAQVPGLEPAAAAARAGWQVRPFALTQVRLGESLFTEKRDRMLNYLRNYGSATDWQAGPDRMLAIFRANAGLDTKGAKPPGDWENETGYLRGHYAGHFMSALAQAAAGTGDPIYKQKLDYMIGGLAECQAALAAAAKQPTPRAPGKFGNAVVLTGSPIGNAEHVQLPQGVMSGLEDFTVALWVKPEFYAAPRLPDQRPNQDLSALYNGTAIFEFGRHNGQYAEAPLARMYLSLRASREQAGPRFAITTNGADAEQRLDSPTPLAADTWTHVAVTKQGSTGTLFIDGVAVATNAAMTLKPADLGVTTDNWLGRRVFPQRNVSYLNAQLDEFQIWDRALSAAEVKSLQGSAGGSTGGGNVVWYRFDEGNGKVVEDASGKGRHGTVNGPLDGRRHPGFLSAYPETQFVRLEEFATYGGNQGIWAPYYTLHKIMAGLIDAHSLTGNQQALGILTGIGDWVHSRLAPLRPEQLDRMFNIYIAGEYGGVNESLAQLNVLRPKPEYVAAARAFDNRNVKVPTQENRDILDGRHANQHIPQFIGYLRLFEQSDVPEYYAAAQHFWDMVVPHRIYSHGGVGVGEMFRARDVIAGSLWQFPNDHNHAETCPLYNMLKLSRNLFFHEPDPKYMNYYEHGLFNQMLASRRDVENEDSPEVTYFVPVRPGERREYGNTGTCCGGTGMENHTKYQDSIYFRSVDDGTLYVNLYIPSTLDWKEKGFTIAQATRFPFEGASTLTVNGSGPLTVMLRVPVWATRGFTVRVNGKAEQLAAVPGTYVALEREWRPGDRIDVSMPMSFRVTRTIDDPNVQSLFYGPTLLALQAPPAGTDLASGLIGLSLFRSLKLAGDLGAALVPVPGKPLHFTLAGHTLAPFHVADPQPGETQPYHMYFRREEPTVAFGSVDAGVKNAAGEFGLTFLDDVWAEAPFASHGRFVARVQRVADEWARAGRLSAADAATVVAAAKRAEADLRV